MLARDSSFAFIFVFMEGRECERNVVEKLTLFEPPYFFSVAMFAPLRRAAFSSDSVRTTRSRGPPPGPARALLPIRVTESHSSDIFA